MRHSVEELLAKNSATRPIKHRSSKWHVFYYKYSKNHFTAIAAGDHLETNLIYQKFRVNSVKILFMRF